MKKTLFECIGAVTVAAALQFTPVNAQAAGLFSSCLPCDDVAQCNPCDEADCGTKAGKWFLNGHIESGFFANAYGRKSTYGDSPWLGRGADEFSGNTLFLQNTRLTGGQINQTYLSMGKAVDGRRRLDIGGTVDFTWGSDAYSVQSRGLEYGAGHGTGADEGAWGTGDYFAALAQAYAEVAYGKWNVKAGKFYAPFGSTGYKSTENFFYTWASTNTITPNTAGGAYATYTINDRWSILGGWAMLDEIGESSKNNAVLGGFAWTPGERFNLLYAFAAGEDTYGADPNGRRGTDYFVHTLLATTQISQKLKYVFEWTLYDQTDKDAGKTHIYYYGLNNEIIYQYNQRWAFGTRFGMWDSGGMVDWYTVALGANWTPNKWLIVKPEVRYDWFDPAIPAFGENTSADQFSGGMSAVVKF